jgi:predicted helicase
MYNVKASSSFDIEARRDRAKYVSTNVRTILYRPFDIRPIYYDPNLTSRPAFKVMRHMIGPKQNLSLLAMRQVAAGEAYSHFLVTDTLSDNRTFYSNKGILNVFPLRLLDEEPLTSQAEYRPNLSPNFLRQLSKTLNLPQKGEHHLPAGLTPEDIFHYAYAVFHGPGYRSRYAEFLKIDFPRLPLTGNLELFRALARLGGELTALHLLESPKVNDFITRFEGQGDNGVPKRPTWKDGAVWINPSQRFEGVPEAVWNFHIGGYQVCEKWLKDRKGRILSADDIAHYQRVVVALTETIRLMAEIDRVIDDHGGWPGAFQTVNPGKAQPE